MYINITKDAKLSWSFYSMYRKEMCNFFNVMFKSTAFCPDQSQHLQSVISILFLISKVLVFISDISVEIGSSSTLLLQKYPFEEDFWIFTNLWKKMTHADTLSGTLILVPIAAPLKSKTLNKTLRINFVTRFIIISEW